MNNFRQSGFTLIELVIVVILLGILAATVAPKYVDLTRDAKQSVVDTAVSGIKSAAMLTFAQNKRVVSWRSILSNFDYDSAVLSVYSSNNNNFCFFTVAYLWPNSTAAEPLISLRSTGVIDPAVCDD